MFLIFLINTGLLIGTVFLMRRAKIDASPEWLWLTLVGGVATFLFRPLVSVTIATNTDLPLSILEDFIWSISALVWMVYGFYFVIWSIREFVQRKKMKSKTSPLE